MPVTTASCGSPLPLVTLSAVPLYRLCPLPSASIPLPSAGHLSPLNPLPAAFAQESGKQKMTKYGHVEWTKIPFKAGSYTVTGYDESGAAIGKKTVSTTGVPATLKVLFTCPSFLHRPQQQSSLTGKTVHQATVVNQGTDAAPVGMAVYAGCNDFALVQVEVLDAKGELCPDPDNTESNPVTFAVSGTPTAWVEGTCVPNKSRSLLSAGFLSDLLSVLCA